MADLMRGSTGAEVSQLQARLRERGFNPGQVDGDFGGGTEAAVLAFQKSAGLLADGVAGPRTLAALELPGAPVPVVSGQVTPAIVSQMFPFTRLDNIKTNLPFVLTALDAAALADKPMTLMALATIRAETEGFVPISEGQSRFNTSPGGQPFDLYDNRRDLGNQGPPDGARYCGRGFIQLTGRSNYQRHGSAIGLGERLLDQPDLANQPEIAARLLASFLKNKERQIKEALVEGDLRAARKLVNGGSHGLDRFTEAYTIGDRLIA